MTDDIVSNKSLNMAKVVIYDIECLSNFFSITFKDRDTKKVTQFVFSLLVETKLVVVNPHKEIYYNSFTDLLQYLGSCTHMIGFNNLNYDYPLLHRILTGNIKFHTTEQFIFDLHVASREIINSEWSAIAPWNVLISQLDLFKIHHFDNEVKRTSLKWVEFVMWFSNVEDMGKYTVDSLEDIANILSYNLNDVEATETFYYLTKDDIDLRKELEKEFGIPLMNANDPKIGSDIFLHEIAKRTGRDKKDIKQLRTHRSSVLLEDVIVPYAQYESEEMNRFLASFRKIRVHHGKDEAANKEISYKGFTYSFGLGGIHGATKPGVYVSNELYTIHSIDVSSYYPNLAISNRFYPEHLGEVFCEIYGETYERRAKAKKLALKAIVSGLKLALNGVFGKSGEANSFLFDIKFLLSITINGQILLTMLSEKFQNRGFEILMINTDGMEVKVPVGREEEFISMCKEWEKLTRLTLEFNTYEKLVIRDVNNYMAVVDGEDDLTNIDWTFPTFENIIKCGYSKKYKFKGTFEIAKFQNGKPGYNKNWSQLIVPISIFRYFAYNIPVEQTITQCKSIFPFCLGLKTNSNNTGELRVISENELVIVPLSKTTRYYVSNDGYYLNKVFDDGKESKVRKGYKVTVMNNYEEMPIEYRDINYLYYVRECYKIIDVVDTKQLKLFN